MHMNRRELLGSVAGAAAFSALPRYAAAQSADTLRIAAGGSQIVTFDPIRQEGSADTWAIIHVHDALARSPNGAPVVNDPKDFVPELATSWSFTPDAKSWSFKLKQGVQFHKGYGEMTSDDVIFSFKRLGDRNAGSLHAQSYTNIADIKADGPYGVTFYLKAPDPLFMSSVINEILSLVVSRKAVTEKGDNYGRDPVGTGPYMVDSAEPKTVRLVANPNYHGGPPKIPKLEVQYILDSTARTLALLSGSVDMILAPSNPGAIPSIQQRDPKLVLDVVTPGNVWNLHFNLTRKPFDDIRVRKAFFYAIDRDKIAKALQPPVPRRFGMLPAGLPGAYDDATIPKDLRYDYDPAKAKALLKEAGFPNGFSFTDFTSQRDDYLSLMLIVQEQLRQVGVTYDLQPRDHAAFRADARKDLSAFYLRGFVALSTPLRMITDDAEGSGSVKPDGSGGQNYSHYGQAIPGVDDLIAKAREETDLKKYIELCRQMDLKILTDAPILPLCTTAYVYIHNPRLDYGFKVTSGTGFWRLNGATFKA